MGADCRIAHRAGREPPAQLLHLPFKLLPPNTWTQDYKFIPANAVVAGLSKDLPHLARTPGQHLVSLGVPLAVIDVLEPVYIQVHHAHRLLSTGQGLGILHKAVAVIKGGECIKITQLGELLFIFRTAEGQHEEVAQGLQQRGNAADPLRRRVIHPQASAQSAVLLQRGGNQAVDSLPVQQGIGFGIGVPQALHILDNRALLPVKGGAPAVNSRRGKPLQIFPLRGHTL